MVETYRGELAVGDRVRGHYSGDTYTGTIVGIKEMSSGPYAYVKRDDGKRGAGENIGGIRTWRIIKKHGKWGADGSAGKLELLKITNWKEELLKA